MAHVFGIWCESRADALIIWSMIAQMCVNREAEHSGTQTNKRKKYLNVHIPKDTSQISKVKILKNKYSVQYHKPSARIKCERIPNACQPKKNVNLHDLIIAINAHCVVVAVVIAPLPQHNFVHRQFFMWCQMKMKLNDLIKAHNFYFQFLD